jgi:hypothetical protein
MNRWRTKTQTAYIQSLDEDILKTHGFGERSFGLPCKGEGSKGQYFTYSE